MLKALELVGFKSFADKTRFEFPEGITVIVGPNGSGKSNIVDAIKWVLGEQSAKSLRGKEMADVIFKGSGGASGRKAMNTAEATIIIDNSDGRFGYDAPEIHITRRVYRSGEGEYLINRQPCRLKDIRDLFRGTGVGTDAYSLIEQGKVDQLLQSTAKDRRAIFEEAAGISRFKAKRIEAQRRLERVDQNLLRLSDIVDEVESRLRTVRAQAGKARRYQQYTDRLQQLRTHVGYIDWRKLSEQLAGIQSDLARLGDRISGVAARAEAIDARTLEIEVDVAALDETIRAGENRCAKNRERIVQLESSAQHQWSRQHDLEQELARRRQQLAAMSTRAGQLEQQLGKTREAVQQAEADHRQIAAQLAEHEQRVRELSDQLERRRSENESRRDQYVEQMRAAAALGNQVSAYESQWETARTTADRARERLETLHEDCRALSEQVNQLQAEKAKLAQQSDQKAVELEGVQRALETGHAQLAERKEELGRLRLRHSGATERMGVLQELERNFEGIGAGVRQVLAQSKRQANPPFGKVHGLVADLLHADVELAPLVDAALGGAAQHVVVAGTELLEHLRRESLELAGPVGFVRLDGAPPHRSEAVDLTGRPGVVGRVDRLVKTAAQYRALADRLLGDTWLVDRLPTALDLSRSAGPGLRFVTLSGDLLEADGTILVGSRQPSGGLVSRGSQLRSLGREIADLEQQIEIVEQQIDRQQAELYHEEQLAERLTDEHKQAYLALSECQVRCTGAEQRLAETAQRRLTVEAELKATLAQAQAASAGLEAAGQQLATLNAELAALEASIGKADQSIEQLERQRQSHIQQATAAKVAFATSQQQLNTLRAQRSQLEQDQRERSRAITETRAQLDHCLRRRRQTERSILQATGELAHLYLLNESILEETGRHRQRRQQLLEERQALASQLQEQRRIQRQLEAEQHQAELAAGELRHQRSALADRLREDYGIDISLWPGQREDPGDQGPRSEIEEEIAALRRKIQNLGAVNMDALAELEQVEARFGLLSSQYEDLRQSKQSLERIIHKINADSRRLFAETLEAIRKNFQTLYRKAFGGGRADLVLQPGEDILESGIDIIATPPGKPRFSNSLLSGGEKALTAVSLLLAIFQYRPSPFCVLDEVDAPFDEANIERFLAVLNGFLGWTKFVIVTHSKKTMTAATTLYGVTMQESGVSKRVSVRFDDVSEDGNISPEAIRRQETDGADAA